MRKDHSLKQTVRYRLQRLGRAASTAADRVRGRRVVHMLHVGKTGGTALGATIAGARTPSIRLIKHGHSTTMSDVPAGDPFFFVVRDPVSRFVSGFRSRQRKGRPAHFVEWRKSERATFERFDSPEAMALALTSDDPEERAAAELGFRHMGHVQDTYATWFGEGDAILTRASDVVMVLAQERLSDDFERLKGRLGLPKALALPSDPATAHRSTKPRQKLSDAAAANLGRWYAQDYDFLDLCAEHFGSPRYERPF